MTNQEAINEICDMANALQIMHESKQGQALQMAIKALENQKTMQVELEGDGYADGELVYDYGKCPKCGWDFEDGDKDWEEPYCCHCGQRLHWFDKQMKGD